MNGFRMALVCAVFFLAGYLASTLLAPKPVQAQVQRDHVYKALETPSNWGKAELEANLNYAAKGGWRIVQIDNFVAIFEK